MPDSTKTHMGKPCDICGDIGFLDVIMTCSQCKIAHEHPYCRKTFSQDVPDVWLCEECEMESIISPKSMKEDLPKKLVSNSSDLVGQENTCSAGCSNLLKWEKIKTGKVKFMPTQEVIMLSSGAKKFESPSKNLSSGPSKIVGSMPARIPIKPKVIPPKSSLKVKVNPGFRPSGLFAPRHGDTHTNSMVQQQVIPKSNDPKDKKAAQAPRKEHIQMGQPMDALVPAVETKSASSQEEKVVNKASCSSLLVMNFPPIISSGGSECTNVDSRNFDAENGDLMNIVPNAEKCFRGPALDSSWKGSFEILDTINKEFNDGFQAQPRSKVHRKVYEFSTKMPEVLQFKLLPRYLIWTEIFQDECPDEDDIGLYFFSSNGQRSANYIFLVEFIATEDLVMRSYMDGVELLVFTSKILPANSQRWNEEYFLWGIFRRVKKHKAVCNLNEELPLLVQSSDCAQDNDAKGNDNEVDMDIDMIAGKDVGRVDMEISRESSWRSCESSREENASVISLHGSDTKIPDVSQNLEFSVQQPLLEVEKELCHDIPPGFKEIYRMKVWNNACTETVGAINPAKESVCMERVSEVSGASRLQSKHMEDSVSPRLQRKHRQVPAHTLATDPRAGYTFPFSVKRKASGFAAKVEGPDDESCVKTEKKRFMCTPKSKDDCSQSSLHSKLAASPVDNSAYLQRFFVKVKLDCSREEVNKRS